jgi:hypothetical protein
MTSPGGPDWLVALAVDNAGRTETAASIATRWFMGDDTWNLALADLGRANVALLDRIATDSALIAQELQS